MNCTIEDVVKMYFKVESEHQLAWSLIEMSLDETGEFGIVLVSGEMWFISPFCKFQLVLRTLVASLAPEAFKAFCCSSIFDKAVLCAWMRTSMLVKQ